jgi:response regulator RpfG family c-di-GMP phosphodiesterase
MEETVAHLRAERGRHFDPELLDLFLDGLDELLFIRSAHPDPGIPVAAVS